MKGGKVILMPVSRPLPGDKSYTAGIAGGKPVSAGAKIGNAGVHPGIAGGRLVSNALINGLNLAKDLYNRLFKDLLRPVLGTDLWMADLRSRSLQQTSARIMATQAVGPQRTPYTPAKLPARYIASIRCSSVKRFKPTHEEPDTLGCSMDYSEYAGLADFRDEPGDRLRDTGGIRCLVGLQAALCRSATSGKQRSTRSPVRGEQTLWAWRADHQSGRGRRARSPRRCRAVQ